MTGPIFVKSECRAVKVGIMGVERRVPKVAELGHVGIHRAVAKLVPGDNAARFHAGEGAPFLWGAGTSAYQVEGTVEADGRGPSDWDEFTRLSGVIAGGDTATRAASHLIRWEEDLDLIEASGANSYRFSLSWTRLLPDGTGAINQKGVDFYSRLIDGLVARGIEPLVTLSHMEVPASLAASGGWANRAMIDAFERYADFAFTKFSDRVSFWMTMNEVPLTTFNGYTTGKFPPRNGRYDLVIPAIHHQLVAHGRVVAAMRARKPDGVYGIVGSVSPMLPASGSIVDKEAASRVDAVMNRIGLDPVFLGIYPSEVLDAHLAWGGETFVLPGDLEDICTPIDVFGLNYYNPTFIAADPANAGGGNVPAGLGAVPSSKHDLPRTAFGWPIYPSGLTDVLLDLANRYDVPVIVTENGAAFDDRVDENGCVSDGLRCAFLTEHVNAAAEAKRRGADVRGFFAWSLLDNFEWASGYSMRFGLIYVDFATGQRIPKRSWAEFSRAAAELASWINHDEADRSRAPS